MERKVYIYKITNLINNKVYIGQSVQPKVRWQKHKSDTKNKPIQIIHQAMRKYGIDNFSFEVIASCLDLDAANEAETFIVMQENSLVPNGYNVARGGSNAPKTEEWKQKAHKYWKDPIWREKTLEAMKKGGGCFRPGCKPSPKSIESTVARNKLKGSPMKGRRHSLESKEKNRIAHLGRTPTNKGTKMTDEQKLKISKAGLGREPPNKIRFTSQQINIIKSDERSLRQISKDWGVSKTVIMRLKKKEII